MPAAAAGIYVGGSLLSAYLQNRAQNKAAKDLKDGNEEIRARNEAMTRYLLGMMQEREQQSAARNSPYLALGQGALSNLARLPGINVPNMPQGPTSYPTVTLGDLEQLFRPKPALPPPSPTRARGRM